MDTNMNTDNLEPNVWEDGVCCFCSGPCNPLSQSCGTCSRQITGWSVGWLDYEDTVAITTVKNQLSNNNKLSNDDEDK